MTELLKFFQNIMKNPLKIHKKHSSDPEAKKPSEVNDFSTDPAEQQEEVGEQEVMEPGRAFF